MNPSAIVDPVLLPVLERACASGGINFDVAVEGLTQELETQPVQRSVTVANYFRLLHRLAVTSHDETIAMSDRPLLEGAFHYVLQNAVLLGSFEDLLNHFARSFNMLHGGPYNHVYRRNDVLVYAIDVKGFPYPFDLTGQEQATLLDCIVILVHTLFEMCVGVKLRSALVEIRTRYTFSALDGVPFQLQYWPCRVVPNSNRFELHYELSAKSLGVDILADDLPAENEIYLETARIVERFAGRARRHLTVADRVCQLLNKRDLPEPDVARKLNMSVRTLRRRLHALNVTFSRLRNGALNRRAKRYLEQRFLIEDIAAKLGYADGRSFRRAFLRWNGMTPHAYAKSISDKEKSSGNPA